MDAYVAVLFYVDWCPFSGILRSIFDVLATNFPTIHHVAVEESALYPSTLSILVAMLLWALDNPPLAPFLLISGDGDFANALHRLRLKKYSILLARPNQFIKPALLGAAKKVWFWKTLAKGQLAEPEVPQSTKVVCDSTFL